MVRHSYDEESGKYDFTGRSTDEKPTTVKRSNIIYSVTQGSTFFEIDTSKAFMFDEADGAWKEI